MNKYDLKGRPLNLQLTLENGQAFRWKLNNGIWQSVVNDKIMSLKKEGNTLFWETYPQNDFDLVAKYLRLDVDIRSIYDFLYKDEFTCELTHKYDGLTLLNQDTQECLFSFICSAANSIPKISAAVSELSMRYGKHIKDNLYTFPSTEALAQADPNELCTIKPLAFRGRNISAVARQLMEKDDNWLESLKSLPHIEARNALTSLKGVGKKIADCVCLFSMEKDEVVPVDTHIRQIAQRLFLPENNSKTVTDRVYAQVQDAFEARYGKYAGWAQQFLFYKEINK